jgi:hypothetical protein
MSVVVTGGVKFGWKLAGIQVTSYHHKGDGNTTLSHCGHNMFHQIALSQVHLIVNDGIDRAITCISAAGGNSTEDAIARQNVTKATKKVW